MHKINWLWASAFFLSQTLSIGQINLDANSINFREYNNAARTTFHYGDLELRGGNHGTGWGWLYANAIEIADWLYVYGDLQVYGTKNFIHPHPEDSEKEIHYIAIESGEALTVSRGLSKTYNGEIIIDLPEHFALVTSENAPLTIQLTPEKYPAQLYVVEKSREKIEVAIRNSDFREFGDVDFSYQITGVRDGFEEEEVIVNVNLKPEERVKSNKRQAYDNKVRELRNKKQRARK